MTINRRRLSRKSQASDGPCLLSRSHSPSRVMEDSGSSSPVPVLEKPPEKKTSRNYTKEENDWLVDAIKRSSQPERLLYTGKDKVIRAAGVAEWSDIYKRFLNSGATKRDWTFKQLETWLKNYKQRALKAVAENKKEKAKTGGGPPPAPVDETLAQIHGLLGSSAKPLANPHDSDHAYHKEDEVVALDLKDLPRLVTPAKKKRTNAGVSEEQEVKFLASKRREETESLITKKLQLEIELLEKKLLLVDRKLQEGDLCGVFESILIPDQVILGSDQGVLVNRDS